MVHVDWDKLMEGDTWINGATQATNTQHQSSILKGLSNEIEIGFVRRENREMYYVGVVGVN